MDEHKIDPKLSVSPLELKMIKLLACGCNSTQIGKETKYKSSSIDQYKSRLINRLNLNNDKHLVAWAFTSGLIGASDFKQSE